METEIIDRLFLELSQFTQAKTAKELDLAMLVRRLAYRLERVQPGTTVVQQANEYLKRKDLLGSILREDVD